MLCHYLTAFVVLAANIVSSAPSRLNEGRDVESHLTPRNFYWQCPQGQHFVGNPPPSSNPGACTGCQPGTFSSDGVNCYPTPKGFYNDVAGAKNPIGCLPGSYTDSTGSTICKSCTAPMISSAASTKCVPCADGSSSSDSKTCTPCASGFFSTNGAACNQCQPGSFYAGVACHLTPPGFYNDKPGASDPIGCLPGTYTDTPGSTVCKACTLPFMSLAAATKCIPCADGSSSSDSISCKSCPSGTFSVNGAACNTCQPGTFFAGGSCHTTPAGYYNDKAGSADPNGCAAGMYSDQTGAIICQACASPLMSYAAFAKCIVCADGLTSDDGQYCVPCPAGTSSKGGSVCTSGNYHILIRDAADQNTLGYLSMAEDRTVGIYYVTDLADAITITSPTLGALGPVPLVATTKAGTHGYNVAAALGNRGNNFAATSSDYIWITESDSDTKTEYFSESSDWFDQLAEPNVWVFGSADTNGRYPISLQLVGPNQSIVTCTRFFDYYHSGLQPLIGATCANIGVDLDFDVTVLLFLVVV